MYDGDGGEWMEAVQRQYLNYGIELQKICDFQLDNYCISYENEAEKRKLNWIVHKFTKTTFVGKIHVVQ